MTSGQEESVLSEKDQELIAVGASIASGCLPCTTFHRRAASRAGASEGEVLQAVRDATQVRRAATATMARAGGLTSAEVGEPMLDTTQEVPSLIRELVCVSAAYAIACTTSLGEHMAAARVLGASDRQLFAAIALACAIRDVACSKAKAATGAAIGVDDDGTAACGCTDVGEADPAGATCVPGTRAGADVNVCQDGDQRRSDEQGSSGKRCC